MDIAALVISILAFAASGWAAWATHRSAKASESAAQTAHDALTLGRVADEREATRQWTESAPKFTVERMKHRTQGSAHIKVTCEGMQAYDEVTAFLDLNDEATAALTPAFDRDKQTVSTDLGPMQLGETRTMNISHRTPEAATDLKLVFQTRRGGHEWTTIHYVRVAPPPRMYSFL